MLLHPRPDDSREPTLAADAHRLARLARALTMTTLAAGLVACAVRPLPPAEPLVDPIVVAAPDAVPAPPIKERRVPAQRVKPSDRGLGEFVSAYTCGRREITVGRMGLGLRLTDGADVFDLDPVPGAWGHVFKGTSPTGAARVALKGTDVNVEVNGQTLRSCVLTRQWPVASFRAVGQAPGWLLKGDPEALHWTIADKLFSTRLTATQPLALAQPVRVGSEPDAPLVSVTHSLCRDTATGMPFPFSVDVVYEGRTLKGCGGESGSLLIGRTWVVTGVGAQPMSVAGGMAGVGRVPLSPLGHEVTVRFDGKGRVSGVGHCNRFSGIYALTGERLSVGSVVATRRACMGNALQAEQALLRALETVVGFDVSATGELNLITRDAAERGQRAGIWAR